MLQIYGCGYWYGSRSVMGQLKVSRICSTQQQQCEQVVMWRVCLPLKLVISLHFIQLINEISAAFRQNFSTVFIVLVLFIVIK